MIVVNNFLNIYKKKIYSITLVTSTVHFQQLPSHYFCHN